MSRILNVLHLAVNTRVKILLCQCMNKDFTDKCIISKPVSQWIAPEIYSQQNTHLSNDILETVLMLLRKHEEDLLIVNVFLSLGEASIIDNLLATFNPERFRYSLHILGASGRLPESFWQLSHIVSLSDSSMSQIEMQFLQKKQSNDMWQQWQDDRELARLASEVEDTKHDQEALISIGKSLSFEKDPDRLLRSILYLSKKITGADAGSIYLVVNGTDGKKLKFTYSHTFSKVLDYETFTMPLNENSIAGYVAVTGQVLNLSDVYKLDDRYPFSFNSQFDREHGYRTRSMLVVPMRNHLDEIIGVIQLINCKEPPADHKDIKGNEAYEVTLETEEDFQKLVFVFETRYEGLMESIASQAAIALENGKMIKQIEYQFDAFVKASVQAIESRDAATRGHSMRVADISLRLARLISESTDEDLKDVLFSERKLKEIELAGLLHDFGKVYIDDRIFKKAKKFYPEEWELIKLKTALFRARIRLSDLDNDEGSSDTDRSIESLETVFNTISKLNEPSVIEEGPDVLLDSIEKWQNEMNLMDDDGKPLALINDDERYILSTQRGSLTPKERDVIQSHVEHTYSFVKNIPWPDDLELIPQIAYQHHEMLDGSGYPNGLRGDEILYQARIMAIADLYDALSATDRPYKKPLSQEKVIMIMNGEAERGKIDKAVYRKFLELLENNH